MTSLTTLAQQLAHAQEALDLAKGRVDAIKDAIRSHPDISGPDKYAAGDATVVISTNRRFDPKKALPLIPEALLPIVTYPETAIDKDKLRVLAPEIYEAAQNESAYRVSIQ